MEFKELKSCNLLVEIDFPRVNLKLPNGVKLKSFYAVQYDHADQCSRCSFNKTGICDHVNCAYVVYVPILDTPCL